MNGNASCVCLCVCVYGCAFGARGWCPADIVSSVVMCCAVTNQCASIPCKLRVL